MAYRHRVSVSEVPTSVLAPVNVSAALPVVFGTAPVNLTEDPSAYVNKPVLAYSYGEAVEALGFVPSAGGKFTFSLCEFMRCQFALFAVAPVVFINVLDPAVHKASVAAETATLVKDTVTIAELGVLKSTVVVKDSGGLTTYVVDTDYVVSFNNQGYAVITIVDGGAITENAELKIDYDHLDPTMVTGTDIIGGTDVNGKDTGVSLLDHIFPLFRLVPGQVLAPGFSQDPAVAAVLDAKSNNINTMFKAINFADVPTDTVNKYTDVPAHKNDNNLVGSQQVVCWPKVALSGEQYYLSSQIASLNCLSDSQNSDIPYRSPSNQNIRATSSVLEDGTEVVLGPDRGEYLNGEGIVTALNFTGGWKAWGNRTGAYPATTDPKDSFIAVRRMFNWVANTLILTFWSRLDYPLNVRQIQTVVTSANIWLNGLVARGFLVGARVEFRADENPTTDLADGIARFHVYMTPPSPNREIEFIQEYDPSYLQTLTN